MFDQMVKDYGVRGKGYSARDNHIIKGMKAVHMLAAIAWGGGAFAMQALGILERSEYGASWRDLVAYCSHFVDTWVVMPGLFGCIMTGLFYSLFTSIGFFKFAWITYKWLVAASACFWGLLFWTGEGDKLIHWLAGYNLSAPLILIRACILPENTWGTILQTSIIMSMCLISVYRPLTFNFLLFNSNQRQLNRRRGAIIREDAKLPSALDNPQVQNLYDTWLGDPLGPQSSKLLHRKLEDKSARLEKLKRSGLYPPQMPL